MSSVARLQPDTAVTPAEMLGTVAHELRQPLSHIESIAYHLAHVLPGEDAEVQSLLARIRQLVEQADRILSSGLRLSVPLVLTPGAVDLEEWIERAVAGNGGDRSRLRIESVGQMPEVRLDPQHGFAMVEMLLQTLWPLASAACPLTARLGPGSQGGARLEFEGQAQPPERVLGAGSGLALECARRIAQAHGGRLLEDAGNTRAGMLRVVVMLP